jgi:hypothetical protein
MTAPIMTLPDFVYFRGPYVGLEPGAFVYRLDESLLLKTVRVRDLGGGGSCRQTFMGAALPRLRFHKATAMTLSPELLDWMKYSLRLCEVRLDKLNVEREPHMKPILTDELNARRFCLDNRHRAEEFQSVAKVWWDYMVYKAELDVAWDHNIISEETFRQEATAVRRTRDKELKQVQRGAWLPTRKLEPQL